jgi:hypothetical protein
MISGTAPAPTLRQGWKLVRSNPEQSDTPIKTRTAGAHITSRQQLSADRVPKAIRHADRLKRLTGTCAPPMESYSAITAMSISA